MASGLQIPRKRDLYIGRWLFLIMLFAGFYAIGSLALEWYTTGKRPSVLPLPASALADPSVDETPVSQAAIASYAVPATHPRYISISSLGINKARVQVVGLTKYNTVAMPRSISDAGWYSKSAYPGQGYGSVLIDGHNGGISRNGIFANLDKLRIGDSITIERGDGKKIRYTVVENKIESLKDANATGIKRLLTPYITAKEGLGLITCAGNWVPRDKVFDKRILIRAVEE